MSTLEWPVPAGKVTATTTEEDQVAVIEGRNVRLGTAAEAGRLCVTERSPGGISGDLYQEYVGDFGAPGPHMIRLPHTDTMVPARDERGRYLYNLDAVEEWHRSRPGSGQRTVQPGRRLKWTQMRQDVMVAARDGRLVLRRDGRPWLGDVELNPRQVQRVTELLTAELLRRPRGQQGRYTLTAAGRRWLDEHAAAPAGAG